MHSSFSLRRANHLSHPYLGLVTDKHSDVCKVVDGALVLCMEQGRLLPAPATRRGSPAHNLGNESLKPVLGVMLSWWGATLFVVTVRNTPLSLAHGVEIGSCYGSIICDTDLSH